MRKLICLLFAILALCTQVHNQPLDFVDRYQSTLASGCSSPCTSLSVSSASGLPTGARYFFAIVRAEGANTEEAFLVTNVSGTTLTVTGAKAGTSASSHGAGATIIAAVMTKDAYEQFKTDIQSGVSSGALVLLEQHTASSSATLDFTSCISSTYDEYRVDVVSVVLATAAAQLNLRVSTNGGSSYDSGSNYAWESFRHCRSGSATAGSEADTSIGLVGTGADSDNTSTRGGMSGFFGIYTPGGSLRLRTSGKLSYIGTSACTQVQDEPTANYVSTTAVNAFRLLASSGNIASGTVRCYGVAK